MTMTTITTILTPTTFTFKGINISKPNMGSSTKPILREQQSILVKQWEHDVTEFGEDYKKKEAPTNWVAKWQYEIPLSLFAHKYHYDQYRDYYQKNLEYYKGQRDSLVQMIEKSKAYMSQIFRIDSNFFNNITSEDYSKLVATKKGVGEIAGYKKEVDILENVFINKVKAEKLGSKEDIFGSVLFFGPYGNGKTHITKAIAKATDSKIAKVVLSNKTEENQKKAMQKIYSIAEKSAQRFDEDRTRTIIFIDEAEKLIGKGSVVADEFSEFIKDCSEKYHCTVFAATNYPLRFDVDMNNPDIFPVKMSIDPPDRENATEMFQLYLKDVPVEKIDYPEIVSVLEGRADEFNGKFSNGQIRNICISSISNADDAVTQDDLIAEINLQKPEITTDAYKQFNNDYKELIDKKWEVL